uniref:PCI domain-containing protein n=1 Tax=Arcella intermedia TaxID=1963864 RepID=A0A6B2L483_9EUKA
MEQYASRYEGQTKIARLMFIAERYLEKQGESYKMAIDAIKLTKNTNLYRKVFEKIGDKLGSGYTFDSAWADGIDKKAQVTHDELEALLNTYRQNLIRKKIRTGYNDLGAFHYDRGDFNASLRSYIRTQDYCASEHMIEMCMHVIKVSIAMNNFVHVLTYVAKAESTPGIATNKVVEAQLKVTAGLAHIENRKYKAAAKKFIETSFELGNKFAEVISPQDVAIYGSVCALAEFDRRELKAEVLDNSQFQNYLELVPELGQCLNDFYNSKYAECLAYLEKLKNDLLLDIHLYDHIQSLYEKVRTKALVQYFSPYTSVDLNKMASAFQVTYPDLEKELSKLIVDGTISARIDSHNKRLYSREVDDRRETFNKAIQLGEDFQTDTRAMLIRVSLIRNNMLVKPQKGEERRGGPGSGAGHTGKRTDKK